MTPFVAESQVQVESRQPKVVHPEEGEIALAYGDRMRLILTSEDTGGEFAIGSDETQANSGPPLHVHASEDELWIVQSGRYEFQIVDQFVEVGPGSVIFGPRNIPHTFRVASDTPAQQYIITFPSGFDRFFRRSAEEFATGSPDIEKLFQIGADYGITFLTPESLAAHQAPETESERRVQPRIVRPEEGLMVQLRGERGRGILRCEDTDGKFLLAETEVQPGFGPPLHVHTREDEVFTVQSGQFEFQVGNEIINTGPGTVLYGPRNVPHCYRAVGDTSGKMFVLVTPGELEGYFLRAAEMLKLGADESQMAQLASEYGMTFLPPQS